ncbi:predicted protein [Aspergillus terreus NIH2624]|uniref:Uncharacterized protein n=1 Tax=Aspergillus terreus (strain NIH 2624 / FGSC A1156) TaxID=341663 RepID=Q0CYK1_ASPTN|nr:uncharacterized protein ATEG_01233 [Aspergillus terreus NIH2624]EAU37990.1 predicted protein [Aspergillus terreus NIH2624]
MMEITVGQVSGLLALGSFVCMSVAGRILQSSWWPTILRFETVTADGLPWDISFIVKMVPLSLLLISITGVITPLGLHDTMVAAPVQAVPFEYAMDESPFGYGTPPRSNLSFNRRCGAFAPVQCPGSDTVIVSHSNGSWELPYGYNLNVPDEVYQTFSSGTGGKGTSVSNFFDIQWRQYSIEQERTSNNNSQYIVGVYRQLESIILDTDRVLIEGLVVDMNNTQVGLRNHTVPTGSRNGALWSEDLLFIQPETECVSHNLSIDFTIAKSDYYSSSFNSQTLAAINISLVDHGGFTDIVQKYPSGYWTDAQNDPQLRERAYKAAWVANAATMLYFNVTNPKSSKRKSFSYLDSHIGREFPLFGDADLRQFQGLRTSQLFDFATNTSTLISTGIGGNATRYPNPWNVDQDYFDEARLLCAGAGGLDRANISNIDVSCGLLLGAAHRVDGVETSIFEQGTRWSMPIYTCATAVKTAIKTVEFKAQGTRLRDAQVVSITDKVYDNNSPAPLWGVENLQLNLSDVRPLWGLVAEDRANQPNLATVRKSHLYLPGYTTALGGYTPSDNMPGASFHGVALSRAYSIGSTSMYNDDMGDYTGRTNVALFTRMQELSRTPDTAAHILNLFFTDITSNLIVGTRSLLGSPRDAGYDGAGTVNSNAAPLVKRVKFDYLYGIPAYTTLALLFLVALVVLTLVLLGRITLQRVRRLLARTSTGRILTTGIYPEYSNLDMRSNDWIRSAGRKDIDLAGAVPTSDTEFIPLNQTHYQGKS